MNAATYQLYMGLNLCRCPFCAYLIATFGLCYSDYIMQNSILEAINYRLDLRGSIMSVKDAKNLASDAMTIKIFYDYVNGVVSSSYDIFEDITHQIWYTQDGAKWYMNDSYTLNGKPITKIRRIHNPVPQCKRRINKILSKYPLLCCFYKLSWAGWQTKQVMCGFLDAMFWINAEDETFKDKSYTDITPKSILTVYDVCYRLSYLIDSNEDLRSILLNFDPHQIGHDLYLTLNREGAGFWGRRELNKIVKNNGKVISVGNLITDWLHAHYNDPCVYIGNNGKLYIECKLKKDAR